MASCIFTYEIKIGSKHNTYFALAINSLQSNKDEINTIYNELYLGSFYGLALFLSSQKCKMLSSLTDGGATNFQTPIYLYQQRGFFLPAPQVFYVVMGENKKYGKTFMINLHILNTRRRERLSNTKRRERL